MTTEEQAQNNNGNLAKVLMISVLLTLGAAAAGYTIYSMTCPCEGTPGGILFGERVEETVFDWSMVNEVELCQLQVAAGFRPHSLNLNCWATPEGDLHVGCMSCESKYWGYQVDPDEAGFIRIAGRVYPVTINRIADPEEMDRIWRSRFHKLNQLSSESVPETARVDGWWTFSLESRASS